MTDSLRLVEFSDRELLFLAADNADPDGWTTSQEVAKAIDLTHKNPNSCVGSRFAWLRRYGAMEREGKRWRITPIGRALMEGRLSAEQQRALQDAQPEQLLVLTRAVTEQFRTAGQTAATLMRREWTYGTARRNGK